MLIFNRSDLYSEHKFNEFSINKPATCSIDVRFEVVVDLCNFVRLKVKSFFGFGPLEVFIHQKLLQTICHQLYLRNSTDEYTEVLSFYSLVATKEHVDYLLHVVVEHPQFVS